jgi:hypothetical protein
MEYGILIAEEPYLETYTVLGVVSSADEAIEVAKKWREKSSYRMEYSFTINRKDNDGDYSIRESLDLDGDVEKWKEANRPKS